MPHYEFFCPTCKKTFSPPRQSRGWAKIGDQILLTRGLAIEGTATLQRGTNGCGIGLILMFWLGPLDS